ncbi:MAG: hypothetical protein IKV59_01400 [Lachnospiraceae bacterium]|nr:hypothetical protein [Lachnospiraceae bacterium]
MRRRRNHSRNDIIIDLTSLLDVIFIILFVVLCSQTRMNESMEEELIRAENAQTQAEAEQRLYEEQREIADHLNQYVWAASIEVPYDEKEITHRQIKVLKEGTEIETFELIGNETSESFEAFKNSLADFIQTNQDKPVIFSLNENDDYILYRDEVMVNQIFVELAREYNNVYIKGNISEETK